jgi:two-component system invasion response regulator UvrY
MPARILIADGHSIVRTGVRTIIKDHVTAGKIDEAATEAELVALVKTTYYDTILLDIGMPGTDFVGLMHWIQNNSPGTGIIIFSMYTEAIYGHKCEQLGARGFLHKGATNAEIIYTLKTVLEGGTCIRTRSRSTTVPINTTTDHAHPISHLSSRELEIALLLVKGYKLPEICLALHIQYSTVNTYKRRIFEKLNVPNAVALSQLISTFQMDGNTDHRYNITG